MMMTKIMIINSLRLVMLLLEMLCDHAPPLIVVGCHFEGDHGHR